MVLYDIMEDNQGYIWLGTEAGICRYDGVHFETFKVPEAQGKSFTTLQKDTEGRIYFTNFSKQLFYIYQGKVQTVSLPPQLQKQGVDRYLIDRSNRLWVSGNRGVVFVKDRQKQQWQQMDKQAPAHVTGAKFFLDTKGKVWILYHQLLIQVNEQLKPERKLKVTHSIVKLVFTKEEAIIYSSNGSFYSYHLTQGNRWQLTFKGIKPPQAKVLSLVKDRQGEIWACTYRGVKRYFHRQKPSGSQLIFLENKFVSGMIQDRENNYWFTTVGNGLFKMSNKDIMHFNSQNSAQEFEQINCMTQDSKGNLFIGTNSNQLYYFDTKKQKFTQKYRLPQGDIECILLDSIHQKLYVENGQVYVFSLHNMKQTETFWMGSTPKSFSIYQNKYLITASGDQAYVGHVERSIGRFKPIHLLPQVAQDSVRNQKRLRNKRSRVALAEAKKPRFWIGYADGLYFYEGDQVQELKTSDQQSIIALGMSQDTEEVLWVGTVRQGVFAIKNKQVIRHLHPGNGLISDYCREVFREGNLLYLGTNKGLQVYNLQTGQARVFNQADGLPSNEVRDLIVQQEKIYLATTAGLSVLDKNFNTTNYIPPLIYITGLSIHDQPQKLQKQYRLAYNRNNLTFYFTGIALRSNGKFRYKYRMEGLDKKWHYNSSTNNLARYSALPSGKYRFQVKTMNEDGIESEKTATIDIKIAYPIWERWWFILLVVLLALALMAGVTFIRLRAYRRKTRLEKALNKAGLESLKLQMNPHFIFNAMGAIQHYMFVNDSAKASDYLARFSRLMRAVLENSRQEYISLDEEIEMLENYLILQNLRYEGNFKYQIIVSDELDPEIMAIPPMFAQPFIENAIEHGIAHLKGDGKIEICFSHQNNMICLEITDNGIGIQQALKTKEQNTVYRSLATAITKERIKLYQQSLKKNIAFEVESLDRGTRVVFYLPYQLI